jgi:BlaI family penicillinase repressor
MNTVSQFVDLLTKRRIIIMVKLSDCEINIMHIIWTRGEATSFDIMEIVAKNGRLAQNTVRTLLARMVKKGAISVSERKGKVYVYKPLIKRDEFLEQEAMNFLDNVYNGDIQRFIINCVKNNKISKNDVKIILSEI